jgi:hypothetical protein
MLDMNAALIFHRPLNDMRKWLFSGSEKFPQKNQNHETNTFVTAQIESKSEK